MPRYDGSRESSDIITCKKRWRLRWSSKLVLQWEWETSLYGGFVFNVVLFSQVIIYWSLTLFLFNVSKVNLEK